MLNVTPIHRSANRTNLFMGGDREMVMFSGLLAATLIFASMNWVAAIAGVFLWCVNLYLLRLMAKSDPRLRDVYIRHIKYAAYYPARSTPFRINRGKPYR
ncbi:MAG: conjugal transfer protein TrbD [Acetobacter sp.]|nr:conjugal transfer protein TrbD [Acetobacter sp.]